MKFPKLKHTVLCQVLLYFPAFTFFWYLLALCFFEDSGQPMSGFAAAGLFLSGAFSLWYLFRHLVLFMGADVLFASIRSWQRDRLVYRTFRNGRDRAAVEQRILRRCRRWGRRLELPESQAAFRVYYRHCSTMTVFYSGLEKRIAVCSTDCLTAERCRYFLGMAQGILRQIPDGKPHLKTRREQKAPRMRASVVVILADRVEPEVRELARTLRKTGEYDCIFPCVAECSAGSYFLNGTREYFELGLMPRPAGNYASALAQRLVFGGRLPKEDWHTQPACTLRDSPDITLWEFLREHRSMLRQMKTQEEKERAKMLRALRSGEIRFGEGAIYCKTGNFLAACACLEDEEDPKSLSLLQDGFWYYRREHYPYEIKKRKMKPEDARQVRRQIETYLLQNGYRFRWDP